MKTTTSYSLAKSAFSLLLVLGLFSIAQAQESTDSLNSQVTLVLNNTRVHEVLGILSQQTKIPIGFEEASSVAGGENKLINIAIRRGSVRDALDAIVKADDRYKWEMTGGVINVLPNNRDDCISNVIVANLVIKDSRVEDVGFAITDTPEVKKKLTSLGLIDTRLREKQGSANLQVRLSISRIDVAVGQILNDLLRQDYIHHWAIVRYGPRAEYVAILFS